MTVMAGFSMGETYFVPRTAIGLPMNDINACIDAIIGPRFREWETQQKSGGGDKSECGEMFFSRLIPYLVEVLVQDGIYFIKDFKEHPMTALLLVRFVLLSSFPLL